jgi:hypothetical protein
MPEKKQLDLRFLSPSFDLIELPSRGVFYKNIPELKDAQISIRPMTSVEEKLIDKFNTNTFYQTVDEIISKCIREDINIDDLTPGDRIFTLMKIRAISAGSEYEVRFKCASCDSEMPVKIDLAEFDPVYLEEDVIEPVELKLPISEATVRMYIPRSGHIRESNARSFADQKKRGVFISPSVYQKALCCHEFVFPEKSSDAGYIVNQTDFNILLGIMGRLHVKDMKAIEDMFNDYDHGMIDPVIKYCPVCDEAYDQYAAINWDFFRPRSDRRRDTEIQQLFLDVQDGTSNNTNRKRTGQSSKVREIQLDRHSTTNILSEEKISEENI